MTHSVPKQAMVLAAGLGKRMRPLTDHIPKPMIEVAGRTLIDRAIDHLAKVGVSKIIVNTSYKAEILEKHLATRSSPKIYFSREEEPLETGGGIAQALHYFDNSPFFCVGGDVVWVDGETPALQRLAQHWNDNLDALLLMQSVKTAIGYDGKGDFFMNESGILSRRGSQTAAPYVYTTLQILHPRLFVNCPAGAFSLNILYDRAMQARPPRLKGLLHDGAWLHVGDVTGKEKADEYILSLD